MEPFGEDKTAQGDSYNPSSSAIHQRPTCLIGRLNQTVPEIELELERTVSGTLELLRPRTGAQDALEPYQEAHF